MQISYSCTANLERLILPLNKHIFNMDNQGQSQCYGSGSCKVREGGNCFLENIIYMTTVNSDLGKKFYIGLCPTNFRYAYHRKSTKDGLI